MTRIGLSIGFALAALVPLSAAADDQTVVAQPNSLKWAPAPPALPKGAQIAVLSGDPGKEGPYVYRMKLPAGYKVAAHMHPGDENVTVISGTAHIGMGDKLDEQKGEALAAGGYFHMPKGMHHYGLVYRRNGDPAEWHRADRNHLSQSGRRPEKDQLRRRRFRVADYCGIAGIVRRVTASAAAV